MRRRGVLFGAVAAAAGGAGLWFAQRRAGDLGDAPAALWDGRWPRPDGAALEMAALRGRPLFVNFWATWCAPCVREMPALDRFAKAQAAAGWSVVGLAIDQPAAVQEFLKRVPVGFPIGLVGAGGTGLMRELGNVQGGLPFSVVLDARGAIVWRKLGETGEDELAALPGRVR